MTVDLASPDAIDKAGEIVRNEYGIPDLVFNVTSLVYRLYTLECLERWNKRRLSIDGV